jgi:hypothetical protein
MFVYIVILILIIILAVYYKLSSATSLAVTSKPDQIENSLTQPITNTPAQVNDVPVTVGPASNPQMSDAGTGVDAALYVPLIRKN